MRESLYLEGNNNFLQILKKIPAFKPFDDDILKNLLRLSKIRTYSPSEIIIKEGEKENSMYLLISGSVSISKNKEKLASLNKTGEIFGEMGMLEKEPRFASVTAEEESTCLLIDAEYLDSINDNGKNSFHASMYLMLSHILSYRLRITTSKYTNALQEIEKLRKDNYLLKNGFVG